jgi:Ner family transcriptional regulator
MSFPKAKKDTFDIRRALANQGENLTSIALKHGMCESICRSALIKPSPTGERLILKYTGFSAHDVWPDRYTKSGVRRSARTKNSKHAPAGKRKTEKKSITTTNIDAKDRKGRVA